MAGGYDGGLPQLPPGAEIDEALLLEVYRSVGDPRRIWGLQSAMRKAEPERGYDAARWLAQGLVLDNLDRYLAENPRGLLALAWAIMDPPARAQIARRLLKDRDVRLRQRARQLLVASQPPDGEGEYADAWDWTAWTRASRPGRLGRHKVGSRAQVAHGVPKIENVGQLRAALRIPTPGQLGYLLQASDGPYVTFQIPKRSGGQRQIAAPRRQLRAVQRRILQQILEPQAPHDAAHGFVKGRSTVTNAAPHVGRAILVRFDLRDFFPTLQYWRLVGLFTSLGYDRGNLQISTDDDSRAVSPTLARLCVYTDESWSFGSGHAPQGAPTSPAISNLVCRRLDSRLQGIAAHMEGTYTRYADDMTFSFDDEPAQGIGRLRWWVQEICRQEGFRVNHEKFRVIRRSQRQQVTGIVVNDALRVPRAERRRFRAILHNCRRHGWRSQARGRADFPDWLRGFASYVNMVHPEEGARLLQEVDQILGSDA